MADEAERQLVVFDLAGEAYGVNIGTVREIIRMQAVTLCDGALFWLPWRPQPTVVLDAGHSGILALEHIGVLVVTVNETTRELTAAVRVP